MSKWRNVPIRTIDRQSAEFPKRLKEIKGCPKRLFFRGRWDIKIWDRSISVVGSRKMTRYGKEVLEANMAGLVTNGVAIISGFMYGVDSEAHRLCLRYQGKTAAVLGGGLDVVYPRSNESLYQEIIDSGGLMISEYENNFEPTRWSFPQRNRIVAGLASLGLLVVEAGVDSGSLVTVEWARKYGKTVWAVPGPIFSWQSKGCNGAIKTGKARLFESVDDVLNIDNLPRGLPKTMITEDKLEQRIWEAIGGGMITADELAKECKIDVAELAQILTIMQLKGLVEEENGKYFQGRH